MGHIICDRIVNSTILKEGPSKKLLFPCLISKYVNRCLIAHYSSDIVFIDLGEKKVTKKIKVDIRKSRDVEAKNKLLHKPSKSKQLIPAFASSVDHQNYIDRVQFQELK